MVISRQALEEFKVQQIRDCNWAKQLDEQELREQLRDRGLRHWWFTKPRDYQQRCILMGLKLSSLFLLLDPGLGKSLICLYLFQARKLQGKVRRMLVLVPALANVDGWREQIEEHAPALRFVGLDDGSKVQKFDAVYDPNNEIVCVTYQGWLALTHKHAKFNRKRKKRGLKRHDSTHDEIARLFDMVVWDESDQLSSHKSLSFRSAKRIQRLVPYRYALSGTPMDKTPEAMWSQFYALDGGETLGPTLGLFRSMYFTESESYWGYKEYTFEAKNKKALSQRLYNRAIRYKDRECLDLPPMIGGLVSGKYMLRKAAWPATNWRYYDQLCEELAAARGNPELLEDTYLRMRQVSAGFLKLKDEDGTERVIKFDENPKLDVLVQLLSEIPKRRKVLIYTEHKPAGEIVMTRLQQEGISAVRLFSGTKDKRGAIRQFKADPNIRCLVGSKAVVYGLNLQVANYGIMYQSSDSTRAREQFERRLLRQGQTRHVYVYDVVLPGIDLRILKALREGHNLREDLLRSGDPKELLQP